MKNNSRSLFQNSHNNQNATTAKYSRGDVEDMETITDLSIEQDASMNGKRWQKATPVTGMR